MDVHNVDDVDMHEEEGQLIQDLGEQQQKQEDENFDEQVDGADAGVGAEGVGKGDGDAHPQDEIIQYEDWDEDLQSFERSCVELEKNDPLCDSYMPPIDLNDNSALRLGMALLGNTATTELAIEFEQQAGFTSRGARAIVGGVIGSQISSLAIDATEELPLEMSQLCTESMMGRISLRFPIGDEFTTQLCEYMTASKSLDHLSIQIDHMTPRGAQVLANFLCSLYLSSLEFCDCLGNAATTSVMQTLYSEGVQHCQYIEELCLNGNVGDMHALATNTLPKLHWLHIDDHSLSLSEVELLTRGLSDANQLHMLILRRCGLNGAHMSLLSPILGSHPSIKSVNLCINNIDDAGVASFVDNWRPMSMIEELTFSSNKIGSKGAELLIKALSNHSVLCSLSLGSNTLGFDGLRLIGEALPGAKIRKLSIPNVTKWIKYKDASCDAAVMQEAKSMAAGKALLEGVRSNCHLLQLSHYFYNTLLAKTEKEIMLYTKANLCGRGQALELQHSLPRAVWSHFFAKEGMTRSLIFLFLRELPTLMMDCGSRSNNNIGRKRCRDF